MTKIYNVVLAGWKGDDVEIEVDFQIKSFKVVDSSHAKAGNRAYRNMKTLYPHFNNIKIVMSKIEESK